MTAPSNPAGPPGTARERSLALYLHIPFCTAKCGYCDFNSYEGLGHLVPDYTPALGSLAWLEATADTTPPRNPADALRLATQAADLTKHEDPQVLEVLAGMNVDPERIWIDHVEEQTIKPVLDAGYWAGFTLYPITKCSPKRAVGRTPSTVPTFPRSW